MEEKEKWHFLNLYRMAMADGDFAAEEKKVLYELAEKKGIKKEQLNDFIVSANIPTYEPETFEEKVALFYDLMKIAWADEKITPEERVMIGKFVEKFGFNADYTDDIIEHFHKKIVEQATTDKIINEILA